MISIDPGLETPYAHHFSAGVDRELPGSIALATNVIFVRGFKQLSTLDYNPLVAALGANRRPADVNGVPGTSASVLQYTSFGETWYRGLTVSASRRFVDRHQFMVSYTLSKAEDNGTDFQSEFIAQDSGRGRNPDDVNGLPLGFDPDSEKGRIGAGSAAPLRRERHLHSAESARALGDRGDRFGPAVQHPRGCGSQRRR